MKTQKPRWPQYRSLNNHQSCSLALLVIPILVILVIEAPILYYESRFWGLHQLRGPQEQPS